MTRHHLTMDQLGGPATNAGCISLEAPDCCPESALQPERVKQDTESESEASQYADASEKSPPGAQILGVVILEFGILFHSVCSGSFPDVADDS